MSKITHDFWLWSESGLLYADDLVLLSESGLLYADDLVLLSESEKGLQSCLDIVVDGS